MGKVPIRRSQSNERVGAVPVQPVSAPAVAQRRPQAVPAPAGTALRRATLLGHSVQRIAAGLIQPKLTLGPVADTYEQEADSVAQQVMQHISSPAPAAPEGDASSAAPLAATASSASAPAMTAQRAAPLSEEELKTKPLPGAVQRDELEDQVKMKPMAGAVQRDAPEDELKMKPLAGSLQRAPEDELQEKSIASVQRSAGAEGGPIGGDLERSIEGARSGGGALDSGLRSQMEPAFGADFSGVRIHSDAQSHQLNDSLQARAFTTGSDIFFRGGEYQPQSSAGQELIAHELTHVVQQGASPTAKKS